jgi:hypothetical protein
VLFVVGCCARVQKAAKQSNAAEAEPAALGLHHLQEHQHTSSVDGVQYDVLCVVVRSVGHV